MKKQKKKNFYKLRPANKTNSSFIHSLIFKVVGPTMTI